MYQWCLVCSLYVWMCLYEYALHVAFWADLGCLDGEGTKPCSHWSEESQCSYKWLGQCGYRLKKGAQLVINKSGEGC